MKILESQTTRFDDLEFKGIDPTKSPLSEFGLAWNQVSDLLSDTVIFFSATTHKFLQVNQAACQLLGYSRKQLQRLSLLDIAPQAKQGPLAVAIRRAMCPDRTDAFARVDFQHRSGVLKPMNCSIRVMRNVQNDLVVVVGKEIPVRSEINPQYDDAVFRDELTRLPSRTWLSRQIDHEAQRAGKGDYRFAVFFVDVDRFKDVNDSLGHLAGDRVLQSVARHLKAAVRPGDVVARYGGDEFILLLRDVREENEIRQIAERISRGVNASGTRSGGKGWRVRVTVSVGIAIGAGQQTTTADAIDRADRAMYRAKSLGRNGCFVIDGLTHSHCSDHASVIDFC